MRLEFRSRLTGKEFRTNVKPLSMERDGNWRTWKMPERFCKRFWGSRYQGMRYQIDILWGVFWCPCIVGKDWISFYTGDCW
ncbi:MAG: hypothetical protein HDQ88_09340 [Clostridia bacterium]|nr:hypothetical protein [Clostridia bacterium]